VNPEAPVTRLLLVRHGETAWNSSRRLQGQEDVPLSETGYIQARVLAPRVRALYPDRAVTSDLLRARQTAAALGHPNARSDPRLREAHLGAWVGRSAAELLAERAEDYHAWRAGRFTPPEAESFADLLARVHAALEPELSRGGTVLVVTHGGVIRAALARLLALTPERIVPVSPGSLTVLEVEGSARLQSYNVTEVAITEPAPD
jgi:glucosyl-3-phosphoglycerate phosphatase